MNQTSDKLVLHKAFIITRALGTCSLFMDYVRVSRLKRGRGIYKYYSFCYEKAIPLIKVFKI